MSCVIALLPTEQLDQFAEINVELNTTLEQKGAHAKGWDDPEDLVVYINPLHDASNLVHLSEQRELLQVSIPCTTLGATFIFGLAH